MTRPDNNASVNHVNGDVYCLIYLTEIIVLIQHSVTVHPSVIATGRYFPTDLPVDVVSN